MNEAELRECREEFKKIIDLKNLLKSAYNPIKSPSLKTNDSGKSNVFRVTSKTNETLDLIESLRLELDERIRKYDLLANKITLLTLRVPDRQLATIINLYYIGDMEHGKLYSWHEVTKVLFPDSKYDYARVYFYKNFKKIK